VPNKPYPKLLDWLRYFCAFMLYMYGMSKLAHLQFNMSAELAQRQLAHSTGTSSHGSTTDIHASML
jgi:hypothetical protein